MLFIALLLSFMTTLSWANPCLLPSVKRVEVPVYPDRMYSPAFPYAFQYFPPKKENGPVIVVIPGGPGIGLIEDWSSEELQSTLRDFGLPKDAGMLFMDPRTVDCNEGDENLFPDDALKSQYLANDLVLAIKSLNINNYVLYGHSYGTVVATIAASLSKPKAVVLTGVLSRAMSGGDGSVYKFQDIEWEKLKLKLPSAIVGRFEQNNYPLSLNSEEWGDIIEDGLYMGRVMIGNKLVHPLKEALIALSNNDEKTAQNFIDIFHEVEKKGEDRKWGQRLFEVIDCGELTDTEPTQTIQDGKLIINGDECEKRPKLTLPFDSFNWQTTAPVFYFSGTSEAVTPYVQARMHFASQIMSDRYFVSVFEGSHNRMGLYYQDCKEALWKSILSNGSGFKNALFSCHASQLMGSLNQDGIKLFEFMSKN